jgi:hypothetical protein
MSSNKAGSPSIGIKSQAACAHGRVVDYERSEEREKTGNLICRECGAIFTEENERPNGVD